MLFVFSMPGLTGGAIAKVFSLCFLFLALKVFAFKFHTLPRFQVYLICCNCIFNAHFPVGKRLKKIRRGNLPRLAMPKRTRGGEVKGI